LNINLTLHGILRDYLPRNAKGRSTLTLPENSTVNNVIARLEIKQTVSAVVNGNEVESDHALQTGDELHMFRIIAGG
jgi:sulfur carrier protein ThiS